MNNMALNAFERKRRASKESKRMVLIHLQLFADLVDV